MLVNLSLKQAQNVIKPFILIDWLDGTYKIAMTRWSCWLCNVMADQFFHPITIWLRPNPWSGSLQAFWAMRMTQTLHKEAEMV